MSESKKVLLGNLSVQSGCLVLADPGYIDISWPTGSKEDSTPAPDGQFPLSRTGAGAATIGQDHGKLALRFPNGVLSKVTAGLSFATGGSGEIPVYGEMEDGKLKRIFIEIEN